MGYSKFGQGMGKRMMMNRELKGLVHEESNFPLKSGFTENVEKNRFL